jgi:hypothetical protein
MPVLIAVAIPALIFIMFTACTEKKNQETIDFFLSQPRDADLLGWWKYYTENDSIFWHFKEPGTILVSPYMDGILWNTPENRYYWYTEEKDRKVLHYFCPRAWFEGKDYSRGYYKIENDSLWLSSGIEGDKFFHELTFFMVRTSTPEGYENR